MQLADYIKGLSLDTGLRKAEGEPTRRLSVGRMTVGSVDSDNQVVDQESAVAAMPSFLERSGLVTFMHSYGGAIGKCVGWRPLARLDGGIDGVWGTTTPEKAEAIGVTSEYGQGFSFGTHWGIYEVDWIWSQIDQGLLRTHSIGFQGYDGGETEEGVPIIKVRRVYEYAVTTVPAQEEAVFQVQRAMGAGTPLCQECNKAVEAKLTEIKATLDPFHLGTFLRGLETAHGARSHSHKRSDRDSAVVAARALAKLAAASVRHGQD